MRYTLLKPPTPLDVRKLDISSYEHLRSKVPSISDHDLESEAISAVRELYPDAVAMPVPLKIGVGDTVLMGILPSIRKAAYTKDDEIPFVLFVQATSESDMDRQAIKKHRQFQRSLWRTPVLAPKGDYKSVDLEMRFHDMEQPMKIAGAMFRRADKNGGRTVLYIHTENGSMSLEFFDPIPSDLTESATRCTSCDHTKPDHFSLKHPQTPPTACMRSDGTGGVCGCIEYNGSPSVV